ncbi:MAG TPA: PAS domain S-box protein, partial [Nitrospirota bacterium]|nr:PAS domain S-box protein [Nitrospirota bacterium]
MRPIKESKLKKAAPAAKPGNVRVQAVEDSKIRRERRKAEARLSELGRELTKSEARFKDIIETSADAVWQTDGDGRYSYVSPKVKDIMGYDPAELTGRAPWELMPQENSERERGAVTKVFAEKKPFALLENRRLARDGRELVIETSGSPFFDVSGRFQGFRGVDRDITDRKNVEKKLANMNRLYSVLSNINQMIIRTPGRQQIFEGACRVAVEQGHFRLAWIGLVEEGTGLVMPVAVAGHDDGYLGGVKVSVRDEPEGMGPIGGAIREGKHLVVNDIKRDPRMVPWREEALKRGYRSCAAFPITCGGKVMGAFAVYSGMPGLFDEDETGLLDELAADISFAIRGVEQKEKRKRAEEALKNEVAVSEALLKTSEVTSASLNWEATAERVLELLKGLVGCESAAIIMVDEEETLLPVKVVGVSGSFQSFFYTIRPRVDEVPALKTVA